jgi:hypothetical protein
VESEGPPTENGKAGRDSNVVRFPRDWIGPRDELVPFGPRAYEESEARPSPPTADEAPPSAADFWGEGSAAVQDALQGPGVAGDSASPVRRSRPTWPRRVSYRVKSEGARSRRPMRRGQRAVVAAAVLCVLGVVVGLSIIGSAGGGATVGHHVREASRPARGSGHVAGDLHLVARGVRMLADAKLRLPSSRQPARPRHRAAPIHQAASTMVRVRTSVPARRTSVSSQPAVRTTPTVSSGTTTATGAAGSSSTHAGPTGPGAPFGPGKLG